MNAAASYIKRKQLIDSSYCFVARINVQQTQRQRRYHSSKLVWSAAISIGPEFQISSVAEDRLEAVGRVVEFFLNLNVGELAAVVTICDEPAFPDPDTFNKLYLNTPAPMGERACNAPTPGCSAPSKPRGDAYGKFPNPYDLSELARAMRKNF
jgi:hypothetical protein